MNNTILLVVSSLYTLAGVLTVMEGKSVWWLGFWTSYAFANVCWIMATR